MKKVISTVCLLSLGLSSKLLTIKVGDRVSINNQSSYNLSCDGATGSVKFYGEGVPSGISISGSNIIITNFAETGTYTIGIKAIDEAGQTAERTITISVTQPKNGSQSGNGNQPVTQPGNGNQPGTQPGNGTQPGTQPGNGNQPGTQSPTDNDRLNLLIGNYSDTTVTTPNYGNSGRYPESNLPTNADPNLFNPIPTNIATNQALPTSSNRNTITPDDVKLRAASERHQNAIKGITNLLSIIDQARANRDKAQNDISAYTQAYNDAVNAQRDAQNDIISNETKSSQIASAINALNDSIADLKKKIDDATALNTQANAQKNNILNSITDQENKKAQLLEELKKLNEQVGEKAKELSEKTAECQQLSNNLNNKEKDLNDAKTELLDGSNIRPQLENDINNQNRNVDDLRKRLQQAENALADAKIKLANFDSRRLSLPKIISDLQKELDDLEAKAKKCQEELSKLQSALDALKNDDSNKLANDIADLDDQINKNRNKVSEIDSQIASSQGPLEDLKAKLEKANSDLVFLKTEKAENDKKLRNAYQNGNDANNRVAVAKQNLDAVVKRFQDESKIISDATLNLERARAEEALARLGLEELIALYTDALPYAIVPNGNGVGAGTPTGNNPSGSPLGPVNTSGNGAFGSFTIPSWTNYLSSAYGAGVNPAFPGSVNELFPFNFLSTTSGNQGTNTNIKNNYNNNNQNDNNSGNGQCGLKGTQKVTTGTVIAVKDTSFDVKGDDGKTYTIQVAPCTNLNSNKPNYEVKPGHQAIVKGNVSNNNSNVINGEQVTCLSQ